MGPCRCPSLLRVPLFPCGTIWESCTGFVCVGQVCVTRYFDVFFIHNVLHFIPWRFLVAGVAVAMFVASTAPRPMVFMSLLQTSVLLVFGRPFCLLLAMSVIPTFSLCAPRPFSSLARIISKILLYFGCLFSFGCSSSLVLSGSTFLCFSTYPSLHRHHIRLYPCFLSWCVPVTFSYLTKKL